MTHYLSYSSENLNFPNVSDGDTIVLDNDTFDDYVLGAFLANNVKDGFELTLTKSRDSNFSPQVFFGVAADYDIYQGHNQNKFLSPDGNSRVITLSTEFTFVVVRRINNNWVLFNTNADILSPTQEQGLRYSALIRSGNTAHFDTQPFAGSINGSKNSLPTYDLTHEITKHSGGVKRTSAGSWAFGVVKDAIIKDPNVGGVYPVLTSQNMRITFPNTTFGAQVPHIRLYIQSYQGDGYGTPAVLYIGQTANYSSHCGFQGSWTQGGLRVYYGWNADGKFFYIIQTAGVWGKPFVNIDFLTHYEGHTPLNDLLDVVITGESPLVNLKAGTSAVEVLNSARAKTLYVETELVVTGTTTLNGGSAGIQTLSDARLKQEVSESEYGALSMFMTMLKQVPKKVRIFKDHSYVTPGYISIGWTAQEVKNISDTILIDGVTLTERFNLVTNSGVWITENGESYPDFVYVVNEAVTDSDQDYAEQWDQYVNTRATLASEALVLSELVYKLCEVF